MGQYKQTISQHRLESFGAVVRPAERWSRKRLSLVVSFGYAHNPTREIEYLPWKGPTKTNKQTNLRFVADRVIPRYREGGLRLSDHVTG